MKKLIFIILLGILLYLASPRSGGIHFIEKKGANMINDYLYDMPNNWETSLLSLSWFLYSNTDEDFLTWYKETLSNSYILSIQTYDLSDSDIKNTLREAAGKGTNIRILTEANKENQFRSTFKDLQSFFWDTTIQIRNDEHLWTKYLHDNFIITSSWFWIQTADLTTNWLTKNREYFLYVESPELASSLRYIFEKDWIWEDIVSDRIASNIVICNLNCRAVITDLITKAKESLVLQIEDISDPSIYTLLTQKPSQVVYRDNGYGRTVTWAFEFKAIFPNTKENRLIENEFGSWNVRLLRKPDLHTKIMVVDHKWLLIGSMNFNHNSLDNNREVWILINDPLVIERFLSGFNEDWKSLDRYYCPYWGCYEWASLDFLKQEKKWKKIKK